MIARTSFVALSVFVSLNAAACGLGSEPEASGPAEPPSWVEPEPASPGAEEEPVLDEDDAPLPGMPGTPTDETETPTPPTTPPAKAACDPTKPFGALSPLPFNTAGYETGARLSADELTIYFSRAVGTGNMQPFVASRTSVDEAWGAPKLHAAVDGSGDDAYLTTSKDDLVGFFVSSRTGNLQIHRTSRAARTDAWANISLVSALGTTSIEDDPFLVPDGSAIYFDSNRSGAWSIYRAEIDAAGKVGAPVVVTSGTNAVVTGDELTMYVSRPSGGQQDIRAATRAAVTDGWSAPALVSELSSSADDRVTWVSADGCRVIVASARAGGAGSNDLYFATKPR